VRSINRWNVSVATLVGTAGRYVDTNNPDAVELLLVLAGNDVTALDAAASIWSARTGLLPTAARYAAVLDAAADRIRNQTI
jgi:hypothetical protein